jgi:hypothetical protein
MQQMFPQLEPPKKSFMGQVGLPIILVIATLVGTIISSIILGTTHIINFNWLVLFLVFIMLAIMVFCLWYSIRTRQILRE